MVSSKFLEQFSARHHTSSTGLVELGDLIVEYLQVCNVSLTPLDFILRRLINQPDALKDVRNIVDASFRHAQRVDCLIEVDT